MSLEEVLATVENMDCNLVEITGGEPLLQEDVCTLAERLLKKKYKVLVETNGTLNINILPRGVIRIVDIKCPDSGMSDKMHWDNIHRLRPKDEVKFVICSRMDYEWAKDVIDRYRLTDKVVVLISPVFGRLTSKEVAEWLIEDNSNARLQLQIHKCISPFSEAINKAFL
jgi:7-carboxy-7-deazaguanine synthase